MGRMVFFNTHYLKYFWLVGIFFALVLFGFFIVDRVKYARFDKVQQKKKQALRDASRVGKGL